MSEWKKGWIGILMLVVWATFWVVGWASETSPAVKDYPCWRGLEGNGAGVDCGHALVDSLTQAKLLWKSAEVLPNAYPESCGDFWQSRQGGQAGPVVAGGRVYAWYYEPAGEVYFEQGFEENKGNAKLRKAVKPGQDFEDLLKRRLAIAADDIMLCLDAETGAVLWKRVFAGQGFNHANSCQVGNVGSPKTGPHAIPCAAYGKVIGVGTTGRVYCLDAKSGEVVWQGDVGEKHKQFEEFKRKTLDGKAASQHRNRGGGPHLSGMPSNFNYWCPTFGAGVFVLGDNGGGLIGFEQETGKILWRTPGMGVGSWSPLRWPYQGREYIITPAAACLDPKDGRVLWRVPADDQPGPMRLVAGEFMLCGAADKRPWTCYRIAPNGPAKLWSLPEKYTATHYMNPVAYKGKLYAKYGGQNTSEGFFYVVDLASGKVDKEVEAKGKSNRSSTSLIAGDGRLMHERNDLMNLDLAKFEIRPEAQSGQWMVGHSAILSASSTTGAYYDGRWYHRAQDGIVCFDLRASAGR